METTDFVETIIVDTDSSVLQVNGINVPFLTDFTDTLLAHLNLAGTCTFDKAGIMVYRISITKLNTVLLNTLYSQ